MASRNWILTDVATGAYHDEISLGSRDLPESAPDCTITKRRLRGGKQDGVDLIEVDNGVFRFAVIPTRGMNVWRGWMGDAQLGWRSPVQGPVHPALVPIDEPSGLGWLDGFDELLVRCGLESNGAPDFDENHVLTYPLHGRIGNTPASRVEVSVDEKTGEISISGVAVESRFHFQKLQLTSTLRTRPGEPGFRLHDVVKNLGGAPAGMQMLYHINFGEPLLDAGSQLAAPVAKLVPRNEHAAGDIDHWSDYAAEQPGFAEQVYFMELEADDQGDTQVLLKNAHATEGVSLRFNTGQLPCFTQWKNTPALVDGYVTGLEPGTNFPNPRSFESEQGRVVELAPGASQPFDLALAWHRNEEQVAAAGQEVSALGKKVEPQVFDAPQPKWCAP
jgi:hypothetical protein